MPRLVAAKPRVLAGAHLGHALLVRGVLVVEDALSGELAPDLVEVIGEGEASHDEPGRAPHDEEAEEDRHGERPAHAALLEGLDERVQDVSNEERDQERVEHVGEVIAEAQGGEDEGDDERDPRRVLAARALSLRRSVPAHSLLSPVARAARGIAVGEPRGRRELVDVERLGQETLGGEGVGEDVAVREVLLLVLGRLAHELTADEVPHHSAEVLGCRRMPHRLKTMSVSGPKA